MYSIMKEERPLISFIVTYYNLPVEMLNKCIDSILKLSLHSSEREIIVVDDGSDNSPINELIKYGNDIVYVRQANAGLSMARNKGIDVSTGSYLQFVDADDQLIPNTYEQCLNIIRNHRDADMVLFDFSTFPYAETTPETVMPVNGTTYMYNQNIHGTAWGYLFRLSVLGKLRFTPGIYHEDEEFTPQLLLRAENVYPTHFKAYFYNKREGSITSSKNTFNTDKRINDREGVIIRLHELSDKLPHQERLALERRIAQLTMDYIYHVIIETHSEEILNQRLMRLHDKGLFPLPNHDFTKKYTWFRKMTKNSLGRKLLLYTLPLLKRER